MSIKSGLKQKNEGVAGWKVGQTWQRNNCRRAKEYNKNIETLLAKQFFPFIDGRLLKFMLQHPQCGSTGNNRNIRGKNCFYMNFCTRGRLMHKRLRQRALADRCIYKRLKIFPGYTGDWFDVKTASTCTTELWDALKSFILDSLKIKVAPHPIIVSLDTLTFLTIAVDKNGFHRMKEERQIYRTLLRFLFFALGLGYGLSNLVMILPHFFRLWKTIIKSLGKT